ncbi:MAG: ATP-binding protein [Chthoniobacterales bacterium]|nr:ATP-binding protein [Chthoniobacterales bacterium]
MTASADFISDRAELEKLEGFTADFAAKAGLSDKELFALQIIVEELVTNVIDYGGVPAGEHAVRVDLSADDGELLIRLTDRGREYNPLLREDPDVTLPAEQRPIGGLGVHFCKKLTEEQEYARVDGCNVLTLRKKLSS